MDLDAKIRLSPFPKLDFGRLVRFLRRPNFSIVNATGPHNDVFPDDGFIHLRGAVDRSMCQNIIEQHEAFELKMREKGCNISDSDGRNYRLVNFHLICKALLTCGLNVNAHRIAAKFFGHEPLIHTSLYFKHGSQQRPHIDTPFFWTQPMNLFCGVWVALEDVRPDAGPLVYYPGSHKLFCDPIVLERYYKLARNDLQEMFRLMELDVRSMIKPAYANIDAGDIFIWHPGLMHGGSPASSLTRTRHSVVFHFSPLGTAVRANSAFLKPVFNLPQYGVIEQGGMLYARGSLPKVMI